MNRLESVVLIPDSRTGMAKSPCLAEEGWGNNGEEEASYRMTRKQRRVGR